jgi:hypothetical protein
VRIGWEWDGEVSKGRERKWWTKCGRESELVEYVTAARPMRKAFPFRSLADENIVLFVCLLDLFQPKLQSSFFLSETSII